MVCLSACLCGHVLVCFRASLLCVLVRELLVCANVCLFVGLFVCLVVGCKVYGVMVQGVGCTV